MVLSFRFGVVFTGATTAAAWPEYARRVEGLGFSTLLVADHFDNPMACTPLLMAAASATTTLRVGSYVMNNDFRHPAMLAKEIATVDVLSGGRAELGIGAGWSKEEYEQVGLGFDPGRIRADRFEEGVTVLKKLLTGGSVVHEGRYYQLSGLEGLPLPVQRPLPLLIGGGGPRMIGIAAREAQIVAFVPPSLPGGGLDPDGFSEAAFADKVTRLDTALDSVGRSGDPPERSILIFGIGNSADQIGADWIQPDLVHTSPYALHGGPATIADTLRERNNRWGLSYIVCFDQDIDKLAPVIPHLT